MTPADSLMLPYRFLMATTNLHKVAELETGLRLLGLPASVTVATELEAICEDAPTFAGNARIKAEAIREQGQARGFTHVLGDDSGFLLEALAGMDGLEHFPGVYSNRWLTPQRYQQWTGKPTECLTHAHRCEAILAVMAGQANRAGAFVTALHCIALDTAEAHAPLDDAPPPPKVLAVEGRCPVWLTQTHTGRGSHGFGYDPVVHPLEADGAIAPHTMAELTPEEKHALSHRGKAIQQLVFLLHPTLGF